MQKLNKINLFASVTDKTGLKEFLLKISNNFELAIISTAGTGKFLKENGFQPTLVEEITGYPPILNGRVKSLHPLIYGAILADPANQSHLEDLKKYSIQPFNMVIINLYQFEKTVKKYPNNLDQAVEQIDIGGPAALRAAAKNFTNVIPVCDPNDYPKISRRLNSQGDLNFNQRKKLAAKVFQLTKNYDQLIINYLENV